jgi:hypothetical protein
MSGALLLSVFLTLMLKPDTKTTPLQDQPTAPRAPAHP